MLELLRYTLSRIDSLKHFYKSELASIEKKSKKGMQENRFARLVNVYFQLLTSENEEDRNDDSFTALKKYMDNHITIKKVEPDGEKKNFIFELKNINERYNDFKEESFEYQKYRDMPIIHGHNTLTMLITRFEEFISNFLKKLYIMYPNKYLNNQTIKFSEIIDLGIDEIQTKVVLREVDLIMRESYTEWFKIFSSHKMDMEKCKNELILLKEIYARRNILVHNSGFVNETYLNCVPDSPFKLGEQLFADDNYLEKAFDAIKKIIFIIMYEATRLIKDSQIDYLHNIFSQAFIELNRENYEVSQKIFGILKENNLYDDQYKLMSKVNYWISIKELYGLEKIINDVTNFDVSAYSNSFALAKYILLNEYDKAAQLIENMFNREEISFIELNEWPLFKNYRNTEYYKNFKLLHSDKLNIGSVETSLEDEKIEASIRKELAEVQKN